MKLFWKGQHKYLRIRHSFTNKPKLYELFEQPCFLYKKLTAFENENILVWFGHLSIFTAHYTGRTLLTPELVNSWGDAMWIVDPYKSQPPSAFAWNVDDQIELANQ